MRLRSKLFYVFLAVLLIVASIAEASKRGKRHKKKNKKKGEKMTLITSSGSGGGALVERNSGPSLESGKTNDNKENVGRASPIIEGGRCEVMPCAVSESDDAFGKGLMEAVDGRNFAWLRAGLWIWEKREYLLDYVIRRGANVTVWFIQSVESTKCSALAALFDKGEGMIDEVLERVEYDDWDLITLTDHRPELAGSPEKFFRVLDKIEGPRNQERAVYWGVINLFEAERHDLVVPLVNALGERAFNGRSLKEEAIRVAFYEGIEGGNQDIVGVYCEHPVITSERYADGLNLSWNYGKSNQVFPFLLEQVDQGDLEAVKKRYADEKYEKFRLAIDEAFKTVRPTGSRHLRPIERVRHVLTALASITGASDECGPGSILASYLVGEEIWTKEIEKTMCIIL